MHAGALTSRSMAPPGRVATPAATRANPTAVSRSASRLQGQTQMQRPGRAAMKPSQPAAANVAPNLARSAGLKARAAIQRSAPPPANEAPSSASTAGAPPQSSIFGDVNGDGVFNGEDSEALAKYLFMGGPEPAGMNNADVNGDGGVDISDVVSIFNIIQGQGPFVGSGSAATVTPEVTETLTQ